MDNSALQLIEDYLSGNLNESQKAKFEERLKNDNAFRLEVELRKDIEVVLADKQKNNVFDAVKKAETQYFRKEEKVTIGLKRYLPYAAMIALLLVAYFVAYQLANNAAPEQLFTEYYQPYETYTQTRSQENKTLHTFEEGLTFYEQKEFDKAIGIFDELLIKEFNPAVSFYLGVSHLELNNLDEAINQLSPISNQQNNFSMQAKWYLALIYLKIDEPEKAKPLFKLLANNPGRYKEDASQILKEL